MAENDQHTPVATPPAAPTATGGPPSDVGNATVADSQGGKGGPPTPPASPAATPPAPAPAAPAAKGTPAAPAAPAAPAPTGAAKTLADGEHAPAEGEVVKGDWPDDWRQKLAGDDKKLLTRLERYGSPKDILTAYRALEQRLSSGELEHALPKNPTPEELTEFRKSNGIPEKPEDYDVNVGNGIVWGEADKEMIESFKPAALDLNLSGNQVKGVLGWVADMQSKMADAQAEADEADAVKGGEALRADWGDKFKPNLNATRNYFPADDVLWNIVMGARAEDGSKLGNKPEVMAFFANKARESNPFATMVPEGNQTPMQTAETRFSELDGMMRAGRQSEKGHAYYYGPNREALQAEWRDLYDKLDAAKKRSAA